MNCSPNYTEWSREEKDEFAKRRMDEMKLKNEKLLQRYAEVENDRIKAESRNSAITGAAKVVKKEKNTISVECNKEETKIEHAREWDRGKPDKDHWKSPEHHGSSFKNYRSSGRFDRKDADRKDSWNSFSRNENADRSRLNRGTEGRHDMKDNNDDDGNWGQNSNKLYSKAFRTHPLEDAYEKRNVDRKDTWSGYSRNESTDHYRHDNASDARKLRGSYRFKKSDNQHGPSRPPVSPKGTRGVGYRNSDSHRKSQSSYSEDKYKRSDYNRSNSRKKYSYRAHSRSTSRSGSDYVENQFTIRAYNLWQNDKISEDQTKQNRVEKWVKSVNKTNMWGGKQFSPEQKDKSTNKFSHEQKDKTTAKFPSDQKDKNISKSYSKFERYENNPNKTSDEEEGVADFNASRANKSCENSNYTMHHDYSEITNPNKGASYNIGSAKQIGGLKKKGVQTKRSPQYSSGSSTRNENFRKQRRFDSKGPKNDDDRNRYKPKRQSNTLSVNDSWKNSAAENTKNKNNSCDKYSKVDNPDNWNQDDDVWGNVDQSDIKWKISDEEADLQETKNQNRKQTKKNFDTNDSWNDNQITSDSTKGRLKEQLQGKDKIENNNQDQADNDDGIWSNVDQSNVHWKIDGSEEGKNQNFAQRVSKTDPGDGWEDYEYQNKNQNTMETPEKKEFKSSGLKTHDSGTNEANISESSSTTRLQQNSDPLPQKSLCNADTIINSFKHSVCISDEKNTNISIDHFSEKPVASDDGGWSTVSEEGEIRSDDENANENRKLYKRKNCD